MPNDSYKPLKTEEDEERLTPTPRREALAAPTADIFDEPTRCLRINKEWFSHISGMIDTLSSPELWLGDELEQSRALRQIAKLLVAPDCEDILQDVRFNLGTCSFEKKINDVWSVMEGGDDWLDCVPSGGGGGGGAAFKVFTSEHRLSSSVVTASTSFVDALSITYIPAYSNMLVIFSNASLTNSGSGLTELKITYNDLNGFDNNVLGAVQLAGGRVMSVADRFTELTPGGSHPIKLKIRTSAAGNATLLTNSDILMTVIEYDNALDVFVEDVRIVGRELQKKIGGAWIPVSDSLATILNAIEAKADSAIATNVTQASQIANIVTVNNTQNTRLGAIESDIIGINVLNTTQNTRLTVLEEDMANVQSVASSAYSIATGAVTVNTAQQTQINTATSTNNTQDTRLNLLESNLSSAQGTIATHTSQITNLAQSVATLNFDGAWAHSFDFTIDDYDWGISDAGLGWVAGQGWHSSPLDGLRIGNVNAALAENQVTHACARIKMLAAPLVGIEFAWTIQDGDLGSLLYGGIGGQSIGWLRVRNSASGSTSTGHLFVDFQPFGDFYLTALTFLGRGFHNPFI